MTDHKHLARGEHLTPQEIDLALSPIGRSYRWIKSAFMRDGIVHMAVRPGALPPDIWKPTGVRMPQAALVAEQLCRVAVFTAIRFGGGGDARGWAWLRSHLRHFDDLEFEYHEMRFAVEHSNHASGPDQSFRAHVRPTLHGASENGLQVTCVQTLPECPVDFTAGIELTGRCFAGNHRAAA
ncbi:MAG: hypothetical protein H6812_04430 [Phycisphaeraceae bacterium]|nr:hypothetical protein [Phycisphaerales bacterium]MCB9842484.1 hypothetical protein [Phycisphaeraceae bacterium]